MATRSVDASHIYFSDLLWLEDDLARRVAARPRPEIEPLGSFDGAISGMQGYVWSATWIVGVWAEMSDAEATDVVFWTVKGGRLYLQQNEHVAWTRTEVVHRAAEWLASQGVAEG